RDEMLTDLVNTTASGFLGLTFTCCRCHDHKYDPFLQADHYRLRSYFAAIEFADVPVKDAPSERARLDALIARYARDVAPHKKRYDVMVAMLTERSLAKRQKILDPLKKSLARVEKTDSKDWRVPVFQFLVRWVSEVRPGELGKQIKVEEQHEYDVVKS